MQISPSRPRPVFFAIAAMLVLASSAVADDLIYLRQPNSDSVMSIPATIEDFTGRYITYRTPAGSKQALSSSVESIKHQFSKTFERARGRFDAGDFPAAEQEWKQDLADEPKHWVQREIRSWLIRAAWRQEHWADAGNQFLTIVAEDPETYHWPIAPLIWTPVAVREADRSVARQWLRDERPAARLLGASLLVKDVDSALARSAAQTLESLKRDSSKQVAGLAKAQLWRNRFESAISDNELASWRSDINYLPAELRSGPQYL
ncbi:MAG TPA: hypothetical protein VM510_14030, partial [Caulifigura sp.]|nr:hypothetical protein [Caulifigura sp.]